MSIVAKRSLISATAEHLSKIAAAAIPIFGRPFVKMFALCLFMTHQLCMVYHQSAWFCVLSLNGPLNCKKIAQNAPKRYFETRLKMENFSRLKICDIGTWRVINWIIRPHCSSTYIDAAYCYGPSSVVCRSVYLSVCLSQVRALQKRPNRSRRGLGCGLVWVQGTTH